MAKVRLYTRKHLARHKLRLAAEREEERRAQEALHRVPRRWKRHTDEMRKMLEGTQGYE